MSENKLLFSKPKKRKDGTTIELKSIPITPNEAFAWMLEFQSKPSVLRDTSTGVEKAINGFLFDISDVRELIVGLNDTEHAVHLGLAIRPESNGEKSHTLTLSAVLKGIDPDGNQTSTILYNPVTRRVFDYCDPCPPACPTSFKVEKCGSL